MWRFWQRLHLLPGKCLLGSFVLHYRTIPDGDRSLYTGDEVTRSLTMQFTCGTRRTFTKDWRRYWYCVRFSCVIPACTISCIESSTNTACHCVYYRTICTLSVHQMSVSQKVTAALRQNWRRATIWSTGLSYSNTQEMCIADILLWKSWNGFCKHKSLCKQLFSRRQYPNNCPTELNTSELVRLLQKSAVEHLTAFRQLDLHDFGSVVTIVTTDFEAGRLSAVFTVVYTERTHAVVCWPDAGYSVIARVYSVAGWWYCLTDCTGIDCQS